MDTILMADTLISLTVIDWVILLIYVVFIIGMGFYLKRYTKTDEDFFLAGRKNSAWVAGVAFMSANMGAMEVIGYTGSAFKYGMQCAHFYLIGAILYRQSLNRSLLAWQVWRTGSIWLTWYGAIGPAGNG